MNKPLIYGSNFDTSDSDDASIDDESFSMPEDNLYEEDQMKKECNMDRGVCTVLSSVHTKHTSLLLRSNSESSSCYMVSELKLSMLIFGRFYFFQRYNGLSSSFNDKIKRTNNLANIDSCLYRSRMNKKSKLPQFYIYQAHKKTDGYNTVVGKVKVNFFGNLYCFKERVLTTDSNSSSYTFVKAGSICFKPSKIHINIPCKQSMKNSKELAASLSNKHIDNNWTIETNLSNLNSYKNDPLFKLKKFRDMQFGTPDSNQKLSITKETNHNDSKHLLVNFKYPITSLQAFMISLSLFHHHESQ